MNYVKHCQTTRWAIILFVLFNSNNALALDIRAASPGPGPHEIEFDICVLESATDAVIGYELNGEFDPQVDEYIEFEIQKFGELFFEATQGAVRVDRVNISYDGASTGCVDSDVKWQVFPDPACVTANGLFECTDAYAYLPPGTISGRGRIACDHIADNISNITILGSGADISAEAILLTTGQKHCSMKLATIYSA